MDAGIIPNPHSFSHSQKDNIPHIIPDCLSIVTVMPPTRVPRFKIASHIPSGVSERLSSIHPRASDAV